MRLPEHWALARDARLSFSYIDRATRFDHAHTHPLLHQHVPWLSGWISPSHGERNADTLVQTTHRDILAGTHLVTVVTIQEPYSKNTEWHKVDTHAWKIKAHSHASGCQSPSCFPPHVPRIEGEEQECMRITEQDGPASVVHALLRAAITILSPLYKIKVRTVSTDVRTPSVCPTTHPLQIPSLRPRKHCWQRSGQNVGTPSGENF